MSSYFRKMMAFAHHPTSSSTQQGSDSPLIVPSPSSGFYPPPAPTWTPSPPSASSYSWIQPSPAVSSGSFTQSPSVSGWKAKRSQGVDDLRRYADGGYQYPAKTGYAMYSQSPSTNSSVSSFGTVSSSSSSSSYSPRSSSRKPRSSAFKGSLKGSPRPASKSKCRVSFSNPSKPQPTHIHPLFAKSSAQRAPIHFDVTSITPPTPGNVVDFTNRKIPLCTLLESATEPPTRGKLTLMSDEFPWPIVVRASGNAIQVDPTGRPIVPLASQAASLHSSSSLQSPGPTSPKGSIRSSTSSAAKSPKFYLSSNGSETEQDSSDADEAIVSNLDVLLAVHAALAQAICQDEWDVLGDGNSAEQRRIARAYRARCQETGGNLNEGVKRVDFLKGATVLVGIESRKADAEGWREGVLGKLVFARDS